jgi:hypothetical protein
MNIEELTALSEERGRAIYEANCYILQLTDSLNAATRERDEARSQLASSTAEWLARKCECSASDFCAIAKERDEARAEVERLTNERDERLVRVADQGAELRATRDAHGTAYRRGAEAMREACAKYAWSAARPSHQAILALPIPEEP